MKSYSLQVQLTVHVHRWNNVSVEGGKIVRAVFLFGLGVNEVIVSSLCPAGAVGTGEWFRSRLRGNNFVLLTRGKLLEKCEYELQETASKSKFYSKARSWRTLKESTTKQEIPPQHAHYKQRNLLQLWNDSGINRWGHWSSGCHRCCGSHKGMYVVHVVSLWHRNHWRHQTLL